MTAWLPSGGLVRLHHDYGTHCTDAPPIYHVASILSAISTACADNGKLIYKGVPHPLNIWTMLLGKSSSDRKTTAARLAIDHLESFLPERVQRVYGSPEGFTKLLQQNPCSLLYVPEGGAFFGQTSSSYWRHAKGMFMDLYDYTDAFKRQLVNEEIVIENPRLTILAATALQLLDHHSNLTDWLGGFLPRFLMVSGERQQFRPSEQSDEIRKAQIRGDLRRIYQRSWGPIAVSSAAEKVLDDFSYEVYQDLPKFAENLHPLLNRLSPSAIRLAALYEIAESGSKPAHGPLMVSPRSAKYAVALCRDSRDKTFSRIAEITEDHGPARDMTRVETVIRSAGIAGIQRQSLFRSVRMRKQILDGIIETLLEGESIDVRRATGAGRTATIYFHVEAQDDAVRSAKNKTIDPDPSIVWIDLSGNHEDIIPDEWLTAIEDDDIDWN